MYEMVWSKVSKALDKSKKMASGTCPLSIAPDILSTNSSAASSVG